MNQPERCFTPWRSYSFSFYVMAGGRELHFSFFLFFLCCFVNSFAIEICLHKCIGAGAVAFPFSYWLKVNRYLTYRHVPSSPLPIAFRPVRKLSIPSFCERQKKKNTTVNSTCTPPRVFYLRSTVEFVFFFQWLYRNWLGSSSLIDTNCNADRRPIAVIEREEVVRQKKKRNRCCAIAGRRSSNPWRPNRTRSPRCPTF